MSSVKHMSNVVVVVAIVIYPLTPLPSASRLIILQSYIHTLTHTHTGTTYPYTFSSI